MTDDKPTSEMTPEEKAERIKRMAMVVCICKGIPLGKVLPAIKSCDTVAEVNKMAGTGTGGCKGQRCGPRIKMLLRKKHALQSGQETTRSTADDSEE
ncbi:MAG: hypothetical protein RIQ81_533 [Pseudomonadota bacterium]